MEGNVCMEGRVKIALGTFNSEVLSTHTQVPVLKLKSVL